jgi:hypothetical protein
MCTSNRGLYRWTRVSLQALACTAFLCGLVHAGNAAHGPADLDVGLLAQSVPPAMAVGDVIFIRVSAKPFREVAAATNSWTNHVGIVLAVDGKEPLIGESTFPFTRTTPLSKFIRRSENKRYAIARVKTKLSHEQQQRLVASAMRRTGVFYDTGFDLHSKRQFCSRYVREVLAEATDVQVGEVQTFTDLLNQQPGVNLSFWKVWYFGDIPWERETVTPASLLRSPELQLVFDNAAFVPAIP